ncbi:MAG TPA: hypothetical protein VKS23_04320 [Thermoanaerobaculia bacterium]|nr:hypothetical protein [Thermoanaerobaculia bacterium]
MKLDPGARLGPYEVLAPLGAGGMGEVYRARDPRLNRVVAIKVLPGDFLEGEERRERFEREASLLAPDGRTVVYGASWGGAPSEVFTVRTESPESRALGLPNATVASVSSTGELALFSRERMTTPGAWAMLSRVPLSGGAPRPLLDEVAAADWTPDGKELAVVRLREGGGRRVELPAGKLLYETKNRIGAMRVSPDGRHVALGEEDGEKSSLLVVDLSGKARTLVGSAPILGSFAWLPSGREILYHGGDSREDAVLRAVNLSGRVRTLYRSTGFLFVHDVFADGRVLLEHAASLRGLMFTRASDKQERDLSWFDSSRIQSISSEGTAILFDESGDATGGLPRAFFRKTDGSPAVRIGDGAGLALSPDAMRALVRDGDGVAVVPVGTGAPQRLALGSVADVRAAAFFPDGRKILLYGVEKGKGTRFWTVEPPGEPVPVSPENTQGNAGLLSPDGRRVIVWSADTSILSILPLGGGAAVPLRGTEHDDPIAWTADGKGLYVRPGGGGSGRVEILDVTTLARTPWKTLSPPDPSSVSEITSGAFARDGSAYAYTYWRVLTSDLYVVDGLK